VSKTFISELKPNQEVVSAFVVTEKQLRATRTGSSFVTLRLVDRTGEVVGRIWENAQALEQTIPVGGAVSVKGRCETYKGEIQLNIQQVSPLDRRDVDPGDFLPVCPTDPGFLLQQLKRMVSSLKSVPLRRLMQAILDDRSLMERLKRAPAAKSMHHAYIGGLLEHTVSVAMLASLAAKHYPFLDRDLLVVGALLHDIGKVDELTCDLAIDYSDSGRLLGHMILGLQIIEEKIRSLSSFPVEEALVLKHLILSHHGEHEFGAVKLPMTREAFVLHFIDDLDAKMSTLTRVLEQGGDEGKAWTAYQPALQRFIYRGTAPVPESSPREDATDDAVVQQLTLWNVGSTQKHAPSGAGRASAPGGSDPESEKSTES
jgi:3'-5' exoribonuclease